MRTYQAYQLIGRIPLHISVFGKCGLHVYIQYTYIVGKYKIYLYEL